MSDRRTWTEAEIRALGVKTDVATAGSILAGLSRTQSYEAVRSGRFPVPVLRIGRRIVVPVAPILAALRLAGRPSVLDRVATGDHSSEALEPAGGTDAVA